MSTVVHRGTMFQHFSIFSWIQPLLEAITVLLILF